MVQGNNPHMKQWYNLSYCPGDTIYKVTVMRCKFSRKFFFTLFKHGLLL